LENGRRQLQSTTYRSTVTFQCNEGYKREGSQSRTCGANGAWSSSQPSCVEIDCGDPPSVSDGNVVFVSTGMDSRATYTCDRGYRLQGSSVRTCQDNEQWSAQSQRCIIVDCGNPGLPRNGRRTLSATTFGAQVTFECNSGFRIEGQSSRECQETGFWSSNVPECVAILCDDPGTPSNGRRELLSRTVDSRVIYRCNDGYTLDGSEFRTCGQNGQWSGSLPSCKLVECGDPGNVPNSVRSLSGVTYSSTVEYTCNRGFVLSGLRIRTCQRSGAWSGSAPSCQIISCGDPGSPRNGFKNSTQTTFGTVVEFDCNSGYALRGSKRISCGANAMWSASAPMCEISSCPDPGTPDKGSRVLGQLTVGSIVTYSCIRGYRIDGVQSRLCLPSRTWTGTLPGCIIVDCGNPGEPTNGVKVGSSTTFGSTVQYRCNEGYELDGNERRECQANGRWSGVLPRCVIGGCGDPGTPSNAVRDLSGSSVGSTVNYRCNTGYTISGTSFRVCQSSGSWSGRLPQCTKIDCGDPGTPSNGRLSLSDGTNFGSIVTYSCSEGYRLEGAETRTCLSGRVWSGSRPVCVSIGCGNPGSISNGNVIFSSSFDRFSIAEFSCSSGYTLSGSQTRVCLANGLWSAAQPDCELVDCGELDAPQNGRRNLTATTFNSEVVYSCNEGYRLSGSSKRTCGSDGKWTGSDPNCNPVDCGDPGDIQNGNRELLSGTIFRSTAVYSCSFGFEAVGSTIRTCQASGVWSNSVPTCNAILCEDPGAPTNGFRTLSSLRVNSVVTYRCSTGYVLDGSTSRPLLFSVEILG
jgi:CUB/sushi domain-containing protein